MAVDWAHLRTSKPSYR